MPLRAVLQMATARAVYAAGGKRPAIPYESSNFFTVLSAFVAAHNGRIARVSFRLVRLLRGLRRDGGPVDPVQRRDVPRVRADHLDVARPAGWMSKTARKGSVFGEESFRHTGWPPDVWRQLPLRLDVREDMLFKFISA